MSENDTTNTYIETIVDVVECPLCGEMLQGNLTKLVEMPTDKLANIDSHRTQMKMTAVAFEIFEHNCERVDPQPEFQTRRRVYRYRGPNWAANRHELRANRISAGIVNPDGGMRFNLQYDSNGRFSRDD